MTFKHLVGKSTLKEGITIHKCFESFFESPESGNKKEITLLYGDNQSTMVALRRLNNIHKHVQIRYSNKIHSPFLNWLNAIFSETQKGIIGEFLEFQKISNDIFKLTPITIDIAHNAKLYVADSMYHKTGKEDLEHNDYFVEVEKIIKGISFKVDEGQSFYNREIERAFSELNWQKEGKAIPELDLKYDFRKNAVQIEQLAGATCWR